MSGLKILFNLILKDTIKGSGSASGILSIGKDVRKLADKKFQRYVKSAQNQGVDLDKLSEQDIKYMLEMNKPKEPQVFSNEEAYEFLNRFLKQGKKGEVIRGKFKPLVTVDSVITDIKKLKPMDSMKETNKVLKGEGKYKNLSKADREKIAGDESVTDHIFERNIEPDPEDFAYGGVAGMLGERTGYNEGKKVGRPKGQVWTTGKGGGEDVVDPSFDELDSETWLKIIKAAIAGDYGPIEYADGGVAGLLGERVGLYQGGGPHSRGRGRQSSGMSFSGATNVGGTTKGPPPGGPHGGGRRTPPPKKKTTTVTTGGASPFPYTKTPKGRRTTGGITGNDKFRKFIINNKFKTALYGTGALTTGAAYQTLSDINKINQWAKMGYGTGNPVPKNMLKSLTGAYVPNKVFEKLGYGPGSVKGWLTSRVSPTHFGPVEATIKAFQSPVGKFATKALSKAVPVVGAATTAYQLGSAYKDFVQSDLASKAADPAAYKAKQVEQMGISAADGGIARQNFAMGRRAFMKLLGGAAAGIGALKTGAFKLLGKEAAPVAKEVITTPAAAGKPAWFDALVTKVINEGDDVTKKFATKEREIVHLKKIDEDATVRVHRNLDDGTVRVDIDDPTTNVADEQGNAIVSMEVKGGQLEQGVKGKTPTEFEAVETDYGNYMDGPDDFITEAVENTVSDTKDLTADLTKVKMYAKGQKKPTIKEMMIQRERARDLKLAEENPAEYASGRQPDIDYSDYDDYASGGVARLLGE